MTEPVKSMELSELERSSAVWQKFKAFYEARLASLRAQNDGNLDEKQTAKLRGRITEVKALLSLGTDKAKMPDEDLFKD